MSSDILFHITSTRKWRESKQRGFYKPENSVDEGLLLIEPDYVNDVLNSRYKGHKQVLLLVIDTTRLVKESKEVKTDVGYKTEIGINLDAILDRIQVKADETGTFDVGFEEY